MQSFRLFVEDGRNIYQNQREVALLVSRSHLFWQLCNRTKKDVRLLLDRVKNFNDFILKEAIKIDG